MSKHTKFILTDISSIIYEAVIACSNLENGINSYPLKEYVFQTLFLNMTGFQEQKLKCILWELANNNYEFRYRFLQNNYRECSSYEDKKKVYLDLLGQLNNHSEILNSIDRLNIKNESVREIDSSFRNSVFAMWDWSSFSNFNTTIRDSLTSSLPNSPKRSNEGIFRSGELLSGVDLLIYKRLYQHRNRVAHNLLSYQENLPAISTLQDEKHKYDNYFVRYFLIMYIDKVFTALYRLYITQNANLIF